MPLRKNERVKQQRNFSRELIGNVRRTSMIPNKRKGVRCGACNDSGYTKTLGCIVSCSNCQTYGEDDD